MKDAADPNVHVPPPVPRREARSRGRLATAALTAALWLPALAVPDDGPDFAREIRPLLSDRCFRCHGPDAGARKAGLRLDLRDRAMRPAKSGRAAIVPGQPASSELVRRISTSDPDDLMPPPDSNLRLDASERRLLEEWIAAGASYERHWAFRPIVRPAPPDVERADWPRNEIDRFVLRRLEREGLSPSPVADRYRLIRRLSLDLLGLPPTPRQADAFAADDSPGAWEKIVDRLLASPAFGERMAWDWLDAARYADSNGYQGDRDRTMWPWRDWVVRALNRGIGYDEFTVWQLAGDLLPEATPRQRLATGFCRNHMINGEGGRIPEENRVEYVMDMTETLGTVWLGLTLTCSRCHDHKFDPLARRDYYRLFAFFNQTPVNGGGGDPQTAPAIAVPTEEQSRELREIGEQLETVARDLETREKELHLAGKDAGPSPQDSGRREEPALSKELRDILAKPPLRRSAGELAKLEERFAKLRADYAGRVKTLRESIERREAVRRSIPRVMVMEDMEKPRSTYMLEKGLYNKPGDEVSAEVLTSLAPLPESAPPNRLGLARWLVSPENPLTARVTVNRIWQQFFGAGLVRTTEDFGQQGEQPSHPELLDWLAWEFRESGWDLKRLCRLIVTSATYRQSSRIPSGLHERDPRNELLARGARFRLPSWMLRDQALASSGLLVARIGGPPVFPYQPPGVWADATFGKRQYRVDQGENLYRRSLYTFWRRIVGPTMFFDSAARQTCSVKQSRTNTPLHALTTLNDITYVEAGRVLAARTLSEAAGEEPRALLRCAFRRVLIRPPRPGELDVLAASYEAAHARFADDLEAARTFLAIGETAKASSAIDEPARLAALAAVCGAILNLDEALSKE